MKHSVAEMKGIMSQMLKLRKMMLNLRTRGMKESSPKDLIPIIKQALKEIRKIQILTIIIGIIRSLIMIIKEIMNLLQGRMIDSRKIMIEPKPQLMTMLQALEKKINVVITKIRTREIKKI